MCFSFSPAVFPACRCFVFFFFLPHPLPLANGRRLFTKSSLTFFFPRCLQFPQTFRPALAPRLGLRYVLVPPPPVTPTHPCFHASFCHGLTTLSFLFFCFLPQPFFFFTNAPFSPSPSPPKPRFLLILQVYFKFRPGFNPNILPFSGLRSPLLPIPRPFLVGWFC